jgi:hypothetical protein
MNAQLTRPSQSTLHPTCHAVWLAMSLFSGGCNPVAEDGLSPDIHRVVSDQVLREIEATGQVIHRGSTPPNIEGTYDVELFVLQASNFPDASRPGFVFAPMFITFSDQDAQALSVRVDYVNGTESGLGLGSFMAGSGAGFSVFAPVSVVSNGQSAEVIQVYSGELEGGGIRNFQYATFMVDDHGDLANMLLDVGQGRVIRDSDGFSPRE